MTSLPVTSPAPSPTRIGALNPRSVAMWALLGAGFVGLFFRWFDKQNQLSWNHMEDWGHAYIIPVITAYLIWQRREQIAASKAVVFWPALGPLLLGVLGYFFCIVQVSNHMLQGACLILTLGSAVLMLTGPSIMRHLFLPIAYLSFMVTVSERIMLAVTFKLQLIASQGSWLMLSVIGKPLGWFSVDRDGNQLEILTNAGAVLPLNVAEACSGMRMVIAFFALGTAVALVSCKEWWQRILLLLLAGPVAILMNMVRVTVLGLLMLWNPQLAAGDSHTLIGTILLLPSLMLFMSLVWLLHRVVRAEPEVAS